MSSKALAEIHQHLAKLADPKIAEHSQRFFKTGPGEYGEGDKFLGIRVPVLRKAAKQFQGLELKDCEVLLHSELHEERLLALLILVASFARAHKATNQQEQKRIYDIYCNNTSYINNWDLVDSSAHLIVGPYLENRSRKRLHQWSKSKDLWKRRISMMATFHYIKQHDFDDALQIAETLLKDAEDLIHKIVGWMLREIGKRNLAFEEAFLKQHYRTMPRTMLRYAIEKFPEKRRKQYLNGRI